MNLSYSRTDHQKLQNSVGGKLSRRVVKVRQALIEANVEKQMIIYLGQKNWRALKADKHLLECTTIELRSMRFMECDVILVEKDRHIHVTYR